LSGVSLDDSDERFADRKTGGVSTALYTLSLMKTTIALFVCWGLASASPVHGSPSTPAELTARIDRHIAARWEAAHVAPARTADDRIFARRVFLDLLGRIPSVAEVRAFQEDTSLDKRARLVARLVDSPLHVRHMAVFWRKQWVPQAETPQFALLADELDVWLASRLRERMPYDRIVRELISVSPVRADRTTDHGATPTAFLAAGEFKPENLAANTTRAFLGINLDCAQCHNHPFARWTQEEFWQTAAFFARPKTTGSEPALLRIDIPNTKQSVGPKLLTNPQPDWPEALRDETGRTVLANWLTSKSNPYFARNAVNRVWAELLGTGLIEPLDDLSSENPASHPELLDELATAFVDSGFDLKFLTTAIVLSRAYQLSSSGPSGDAPLDERLFARAAVRGLSGEQLHDSLRVAAGLRPDRDDLDPNVARERRAVVDRFRIERPGMAQRSILQALSLMNGSLTQELTDFARSPTLRAVAEAPFLDAADKIEALFLATLSRPPTKEESVRLMNLIESSRDGEAKQLLADVFWALLNSSEFNSNH
jgi:hypothetical protein